MIALDRFQGCLLGLALGDALGAPYEGGPLERLVWRFIGKTRNGEMRWTDDTQMALDLSESLVALGRVDPDDLARRFAASYRFSRGYGPGAAKLLKRIARGMDWQEANRSVYPDGSFGNGGAMRSPPVGLFFASRPDELVEAARQSARITHAHPLGEEGAVVIALATAYAALDRGPLLLLDDVRARCASETFQKKLQLAHGWLELGVEATINQVREDLGNGISAETSCVTAVYCALRFRDAPFVELHSFVASLGGDVDTIGAMAGAIWGAANGTARLPAGLLSKLEQRERLAAVAAQLHGPQHLSRPGPSERLR